MTTWGSDVPVSMPEPPVGGVLVPMFGFGFSLDGLFHDITAAEHEALSHPPYAPLHPNDVIYDDADVEG